MDQNHAKGEMPTLDATRPVAPSSRNEWSQRLSTP